MGVEGNSCEGVGGEVGVHGRSSENEELGELDSERLADSARETSISKSQLLKEGDSRSMTGPLPSDATLGSPLTNSLVSKDSRATLTIKPPSSQQVPCLDPLVLS